MEQENTNKKKSTRLMFILPIISILVWFSFCIIPIKLLFIWEKITWTVVDVRSKESVDDNWNIQTLYSPVIKYTCGWREVTGSLGYFSSKKYIKNQGITVLCNEDNPSEFTTYWGFIPLVFTLFWIFFLFIQINRLKAIKKQNIKAESKYAEDLDDKELLDDTYEFNNTETLKLKPQRNLLQKNLSDIEFFKKFPSVQINNALWIAIIALFASVGIWYLIYNFLFGDGEKEVSWAIFLWIFELVFLYLFMAKLWEYIGNTIAKRKIKRWNMTIIQAKVIWFHHTADALDNSYYQILCSDGESRFKSEEVRWKIYRFNDVPLDYLEALNIIYDPKNPQKTLQELDIHPKRLWISEQYEDTSQRLVKQIAAWKDYEYPYWIFNWKRITVWDTINVYIDPANKKSYLVDLSRLK